MGNIFHLESTQRIPATIGQAWDFFSSPKNLLSITPRFLNLRMTSELSETEIVPGQQITYTVRPLFSIPLKWITEITSVEKHKSFVDEQLKGPYSLWHHEHHLMAIDGGVEMTDKIDYSLPMGILGDVAHALLVKKRIKQIFMYRHQKIIELFGEYKGFTEPQILITRRAS